METLVFPLNNLLNSLTGNQSALVFEVFIALKGKFVTAATFIFHCKLFWLRLDLQKNHGYELDAKLFTYAYAIEMAKKMNLKP